jgi:hypothetical protein
VPKLAIIHFYPLELYPPAMNDINYLVDSFPDHSFYVFTTKNVSKVLSFDPTAKNLKIIRNGNVFANQWKRYFNYITFYLCTFVGLIFQRPSKILYFETLSFLPVYLYRKFINRKVEVMVHYHEYTSLSEYETGMKLQRWFHILETKMYKHFTWLSHVIPERMTLFLQDHSSIVFKNPQILPNFPPSDWKRPKSQAAEIPLKVLHIGALSIKTMYLIEFSKWINDSKGKMHWYIYSTNFEEEALDYLEKLNSPYIFFKQGINYFNLPTILPEYDVGLIMYKGSLPNHVYSAPNKLFEYLSADLDVWFPDALTGSLRYITESTYPKVTAINFKNLSSIDIENLISRSGLRYNPSKFYSEFTLLPLKEHLTRI